MLAAGLRELPALAPDLRLFHSHPARGPGMR